MFDPTQLGAFPSLDGQGNPQIHFGLYLPGIRKTDGFSVVVRIIHRDDRFDPTVPPQDYELDWDGSNPLDLWSADALLERDASNFGAPSEYLYRYQLLHNGNVITVWFPDPVARRTDIGLMSSVIVGAPAAPFTWTDATYKTPELNDLVVYELHVGEFNDTFDGVIDRLEYLSSLGVNCLELMPISSPKVEFDWGYGPVFFFSPSRHFGGPEALKRLVDAAHARGIAVILDVVYEHVDPAFAYFRVYDDIANTSGIPHPASPLVTGWNVFGFGPAADWTKTFTTDFFFAATQMWFADYHVDGFRYDEITDLYVGPRAMSYKGFAERVYRESFAYDRFRREANSWSRIIQCGETLGISKDVLTQTYTNCAWTNNLLDKAEDMIQWNYVDDSFAHILDPVFSGYPSQQMVVDETGKSVARPVAPFQYVESHDHSQLIVFAGGLDDKYVLPEGNRDLYYKLQPYAIAVYTSQGIPMLWQGQEFADNYNLPSDGPARIHLRRDSHWEYFYDQSGQPLVRLYRRLGGLRKNSRSLRGPDSYYYYLQSHQGNQVIAYHRHAPAGGGGLEDWAMVLLNFGDSPGTINPPFPKAGTWKEMLDADQRDLILHVASDGASQSVTVNSHYGMIFFRQP